MNLDLFVPTRKRHGPCCQASLWKQAIRWSAGRNAAQLGIWNSCGSLWARQKWHGDAGLEGRVRPGTPPPRVAPGGKSDGLRASANPTG